MKFEKYETYWCIAPDKKWTEEKPMVKPWQGYLHINESDRGVVWTMHPLTLIRSYHWSPDYVHVNKTNLFHTEEEAREAYIMAERERLTGILETVATAYKDLAEFRNETM